MNFSRTIVILRDDIFVVTFPLCMLTCYRNWVTRLPEFKTRINLPAETNSHLTTRALLGISKTIKICQNTESEGRLENSKSRVEKLTRHEAFRYLPQNKKIEFFYGENFGVLAL